MNQSRLPDYLDHIRQAVTDACSFVEGQRKEDFLADRRTQQAVILSLLIIGEAATKLLQSHGDFLAMHPEVPWSSMKGTSSCYAEGAHSVTVEDIFRGGYTVAKTPAL